MVLFASPQSEAQRWPSRGPRSLKRRAGEFCGDSPNPWTPWTQVPPSPPCRPPTCSRPEPRNHACGPNRLRPDYIRRTAWTRTTRSERSSPAEAHSTPRKANSVCRPSRARLRDTGTIPPERRGIRICRPRRWWCTGATSSWCED